jgi:hypothetical protein
MVPWPYWRRWIRLWNGHFRGSRAFKFQKIFRLVSVPPPPILTKFLRPWWEEQHSKNGCSLFLYSDSYMMNMYVKKEQPFLEYWSSHYLGYNVLHQYLSNYLFHTKKCQKNTKNVYTCIQKNTKNVYTCIQKNIVQVLWLQKKNRTVSGGGKKLSGKLKIYPPPPIKNQMVRPFAKRICGGKSWFRLCFHVTQSRNIAQSPSLTLTSYEIHEIQNGVSVFCQ